MRTFHVLFVDDEEEDRKIFCDAISEIPCVSASVAASEEEAMKFLTENFFQLAIVDLCLTRRDDPGPGKNILAVLRKNHPRCERIVYSSRHIEHSTITDELFTPFDRLADAILDKLDPEHRLATLIRDRSETWLRNIVDVRNVGHVVESLCAHAQFRNSQRSALRDEVDFLLSHFLGQGAVRSGSIDLAANAMSISLEPVDEPGASVAEVFKGRPKFGSGIEGDESGVWVVFKFASREDTEEEQARYRNYVSFHVARNRRVEMLGCEIGNQLGVICYTWAGTSPDSVESLKAVFQQSSSRGKRVLSSLFGEKDLHGISCGSRPLKDCFRDMSTEFDLRKAYVPVEETLLAIKAALDKLGHDSTLKSEKLECFGQTLHIPRRVFAIPFLRANTAMTLIHGDLHAGNVIVGKQQVSSSSVNSGSGTSGRSDFEVKDTAIMIDYAASGPGPRCLDFSAMDASIRLQSAVECSLEEIIKCWSGERKLWSYIGLDKPDMTLEEKRGKSESAMNLSGWQVLSIELGLQLQSVFPDVSAKEYCATSICLCSYLLGLKSLRLEERARLLVWVSYLCRKLGD